MRAKLRDLWSLRLVLRRGHAMVVVEAHGARERLHHDDAANTE